MMVPSFVKIDGKGLITAYFSLSTYSIEYTFSVDDITAAKKFATLDVALGLCPAPEPPALVKAEPSSIHINWKLPQPPGLAQKVEVQYASLSGAIVYEVNGDGPLSASTKAKISTKTVIDPSARDLVWSSLASKHWSMPEFDNHVMENLRNGARLVFRIRYLNYLGWSFYSKPSQPMETVPDVPSVPVAPLIGGLFHDSVQLFWYPPSLNNGRPVTEYIIRGRGAADDEYSEVYRGPLTSHLITGLFPQQCYSFEAAAVNEIGQSKFSHSVTALTLPKPRTAAGSDGLVHQGFVNPAALTLREAWTERWDPNSQRYFYFNRITGTRQLEKPECLLEAVNANKKEMDAKEQEVQFRTKRYRFTLNLHKRAKQGNDSPTRTVSNDSIPRPPGSPPPRTSKVDAFTIELRREFILLDAFKSFHTCSAASMQRRCKIVFAGEEGIDSGGLGKEAFLLISKQAATYASAAEKQWMKLCSNGLFFEEIPKEDNSKKSANNAKLNIHDIISKPCGIGNGKITAAAMTALRDCPELNARTFASFLGKFLAKALFDRQLVDIPLSPLLLRHILSPESNNGKSQHSLPKPRQDSEQKVENDSDKKKLVKQLDPEFKDLLDDLQALDQSLHKSLVWMLENPIEGIIYETFSVGTMDGKTVCLCANGDKKEVTDENKHEYVKLLLQWITSFSVSDSLTPFLQAFHDLIPKSLLLDADASVTIKELDLMLNGKAVIDVEELRPYVIYQPFKSANADYFKEGHPLVVWLWQMVTEFDSLQRSEFLQFFTGNILLLFSAQVCRSCDVYTN
jgi:hypothetical protein